MKKHILYSLVAFGAATLGVVGMGAGEASAASQTLNPGENIQAAIDQATSGDVITLNAGTYTLSDRLAITGKDNISLVGSGNAILKYDGVSAATPNINQAIQVLDSSYVTIGNIEVEASVAANEASWATASTGIEINSSCDITLDGLTVSGFGKYGISVVRLADSGAHACPSGNITFDATTLSGNNWGIYFANGAGAPNGSIEGVVFRGVNTFVAGSFVGGTANFGITSDASANGGAGMNVYGPAGARLNVGSLHTSGYDDGHVFAVNGLVAYVAADAMLNGRLASTIPTNELADIFCFYLAPDSCPEGMVEDADGNCVCPEGMEVDDEGNCVCPEGMEIDEEGNCVCPEGMEMDEDGNCVCPEGYEMNDKGECVPVGPRVPNTGSGLIEDLVRSGAVWAAAAGAGIITTIVLGIYGAKRFNKIKL